MRKGEGEEKAEGEPPSHTVGHEIRRKEKIDRNRGKSLEVKEYGII